MKVQQNNRSIVGNMDGTIQQTIASEHIAKAISILRDKIYSDKLKAALTETLCNAIDEHRKYNIEQPVQIIITREYLYIRDFAKGLSEELLQKVFFQYLESTKDSDNTAIGGFGMGAKSPASYAPNYYVTSYYQGKKYCYVSTVDGNASYASKYYECDTTESDGILVKIPIQEANDCSKFNDIANDLRKFMGFDNDKYEFIICYDPYGEKIKIESKDDDLIINEVIRLQKESGVSLDKPDNAFCKKNVTENASGVYMFDLLLPGDGLMLQDTNTPIKLNFNSSFFQSSKIFVYDGDMLYQCKIPFSVKDFVNKFFSQRYYANYDNLKVIFKVNRGDVAIQPSREEIEVNKYIINFISASLDKFALSIDDSVREKCTNYYNKLSNKDKTISLANCMIKISKFYNYRIFHDLYSSLFGQAYSFHNLDYRDARSMAYKIDSRVNSLTVLPMYYCMRENKCIRRKRTRFFCLNTAIVLYDSKNKAYRKYGVKGLGKWFSESKFNKDKYGVLFFDKNSKLHKKILIQIVRNAIKDVSLIKKDIDYIDIDDYVDDVTKCLSGYSNDDDDDDYTPRTRGSIDVLPKDIFREVTTWGTNRVKSDSIDGNGSFYIFPDECNTQTKLDRYQKLCTLLYEHCNKAKIYIIYKRSIELAKSLGLKPFEEIDGNKILFNFYFKAKDVYENKLIDNYIPSPSVNAIDKSNKMKILPALPHGTITTFNLMTKNPINKIFYRIDTALDVLGLEYLNKKMNKLNEHDKFIVNLFGCIYYDRKYTRLEGDIKNYNSTTNNKIMVYMLSEPSKIVKLKNSTHNDLDFYNDNLKKYQDIFKTFVEDVYKTYTYENVYGFETLEEFLELFETEEN